jgi:hypothetical protein
MAERDGIWPGEVAQPRKPPPDLGTEQPSRCRNDHRVSINTRDARTRDPFPVCLRIGHSGRDAAFFEALFPVHGPTKLLLYDRHSQTLPGVASSTIHLLMPMVCTSLNRAFPETCMGSDGPCSLTDRLSCDVPQLYTYNRISSSYRNDRKIFPDR